ncbi:MAG: ABC transporter permease [Candidatus Binataceae bacterium]
MKLRNVLLIGRRDYLAYVARRRFWIGLFFTPALLLAIIFVPGLIHKFESAHKFAVVDQSGWVLKAANQRIAANDYDTLFTIAAANAATQARASLPPPLARIAPASAKLDAASRVALSKALAGSGPAPTAPTTSAAALSIWQQRAAFTKWYRGLSAKAARELSPSLAIARYNYVAGEASPATLRGEVTQGDLFAYFVIPSDPLEADAKFVYASRNLTDTGLRNWFKEQITTVIQARKVATVGLPADKAQWLKAPVDFHSQLVTKAGAKTATAAETAAQWMPIGYVYLLFIAIMSIAQLLMMSTIEEKSSRIAEALLATVEPSDVMAGKTFGAAAVGITMIGFWLALILGLLAVFGGELPIGGFAHALLASVSIWGIAWFIVYFILGFLLYASVLGAIGAAVNSIQEAQPYIAPVTMFMILPMILMFPVVKDPTATWARVLSYFPPLTPFLMVNRAAGPPPLIDYIATTALLVITVVLVLYGSGRIFRVGLLNTGAPPKVKELFAWLRTPTADKK